ncbi:glycosyltransferase family 4 protein [Pedococcus sp. NPDC057267]|uniref:glycosyltransferase family 4 protein n=1 Tax=Pedococcus sp. NPDC057267 TaxID=3346077 RepID=UPI00362B9B9D
MRILHVTDFYLPRLGGIEMHVSDLMARQRAAGHEVSVLTSSPGPDEPWVTRLRSSHRLQHALHPGATLSGVRSLTDIDADVVHVHVGVLSPLGFFVARAASRRGIPTVVTVHSLWVGVHALMSTLDAVGGWSRLPIVWTVVSDAAAQPLRRILGPEREVRVIPNGVDQDDWRSLRRRATHRAAGGDGADLRQPGAAGQRPVVVAAVMRLSQRKRPFALLRALRRAQHHLGTEQQIHLVVAGDGPWRAVLEAYARLRGVSGAVTFRGRLPRDEVRELLGSADAFVAPATRESFGIAALEARCAGLPVVAMSSGGVREFVRHEVEGLLCDDDEELALGLARIARDEALRRRLHDHNLTVQTRVGWKGVLGMTEQAYVAAGAATGATGATGESPSVEVA